MNKNDICYRMCENGVGVEKKNTRNEFMSHRLFGHNPFSSCTMSPLMMIMMVMILVSVLGDDTQALQDTLSNLCSLNHEGYFGSCCENYDISSVTLDSSEARNCFISSLDSTSGSIITYLFVYQLFIFIYLFSI